MKQHSPASRQKSVWNELDSATSLTKPPAAKILPDIANNRCKIQEPSKALALRNKRRHSALSLSSLLETMHLTHSMRIQLVAGVLGKV